MNQKLLENILNKRSKIDTPLWNEIQTFLSEEGISDDNLNLSLMLQSVIQCARLHKDDRLEESSSMRKGLIERMEFEIFKCNLIINDPFFNTIFECDVERAKRLKDNYTKLLQSANDSKGSAIKTLIGELKPVMIKFRKEGMNQKERVDIIYKLFKKFDKVPKLSGKDDKNDLDTLYLLNITSDDIEFVAKERLRKWDSKIMKEVNNLIRKYGNVNTSGK